ncbi:hypothetical protein Ciccas_005482 [Cichlidogyrus casuarinus]|uniref:Uncharacterized protein n=1 Tax=Cichlidogyrus casuarinus TaxID=1844966 RepID=A0ABD2Q8J4_9PLAT
MYLDDELDAVVGAISVQASTRTPQRVTSTAEVQPTGRIEEAWSVEWSKSSRAFGDQTMWGKRSYISRRPAQKLPANPTSKCCTRPTVELARAEALHIQRHDPTLCNQRENKIKLALLWTAIGSLHKEMRQPEDPNVQTSPPDKTQPVSKMEALRERGRRRLSRSESAKD